MSDGRVPLAPGCEPAASAAQAGVFAESHPSRDDTDWHVLAQDISSHWVAPEERAVAYQAAAEAIRLLRAETNRQSWRLNWRDFVQRLEAFAADFCRVKPSLGMVGEMLWVVGAEFDFTLIPRDSDAALRGRPLAAEAEGQQRGPEGHRP